MKKQNKKELGLGIRALLSNIDEEIKHDPTAVVRELNKGILEIPLDNIEVNPFQPRRAFDSESLEELAVSINTYGLIQPITVRRLGPDQYQLISGERRFRASKLAGLQTVPAYIRVANDQEMLEMALVENIQRKDLNAIEVAISYQRLLDECELTHEALSDRIGKDRSTVTNYTRLLKLPPEIQQSIKAEDISMGHARSLAGVQDIAVQLSVLKAIKEDGLSVRKTEELIRRFQKPELKSASEKKSGEKTIYQKLAARLSDEFDTKVQIKTIGESDNGSIIIQFYGVDEFNRILEKIEK
jgi:ParB family transcriptional regulator, chromosome partitioning protein